MQTYTKKMEKANFLSYFLDTCIIYEQTITQMVYIYMNKKHDLALICHLSPKYYIHLNDKTFFNDCRFIETL